MGFVWNSSRPVSDMWEPDVEIKLLGDEFSLGMSYSAWVKGKYEQLDESNFQYVFEDVYLLSEVFKFKSKGIEGSGPAAQIAMEDLSQISDKIQTELYFTYWVAPTPNSGYEPKWGRKKVPAEALQITADKITLLLGKLPGLFPEYLKKGTRVLFRLDVRRSFGNGSQMKSYESWEVID